MLKYLTRLYDHVTTTLDGSIFRLFRLCYLLFSGAFHFIKILKPQVPAGISLFTNVLTQCLHWLPALTEWLNAFTGFRPSLARSMSSRAFRPLLDGSMSLWASRPHVITQGLHVLPAITDWLNAFTGFLASLARSMPSRVYRPYLIA